MVFENVNAEALANIYFDGKVVSHSLITQEGDKITIGLIYPGEFHFNTDLAERMEIISGSCKVKIDGSDKTEECDSGNHFDVPEASGFDIVVDSEICQYVCRFIK
jgi:hypothetical protein|tara:strand:- start:538 stop:852 length:315 start_codon:yes stop_codon:yes gene_type:complete